VDITWQHYRCRIAGPGSFEVGCGYWFGVGWGCTGAQIGAVCGAKAGQTAGESIERNADANGVVPAIAVAGVVGASGTAAAVGSGAYTFGGVMGTAIAGTTGRYASNTVTDLSRDANADHLPRCGRRGACHCWCCWPRRSWYGGVLPHTQLG